MRGQSLSIILTFWLSLAIPTYLNNNVMVVSAARLESRKSKRRLVQASQQQQQQKTDTAPKPNLRKAAQTVTKTQEERKLQTNSTNTTSTTTNTTIAPPPPAEEEKTNAYGNPNPKIGPWPECVGWQGEDCMNYIVSEISDEARVGKVRDEAKPNIHRVYIYVDEFNVVYAVPRRG